MASQWKNIHKILQPTATEIQTIYTAIGNETLSISASNAWVDTAIWVYTVPVWWTAAEWNMFVPWYVLEATDLKAIGWWITPEYWEIIQVKSTSWGVIFHLFWDKP